jgi:hypothetical protein
MFDKSAVVKLMDGALSPSQRRMTTQKELAMSACMDEFGQRLRSKGFMYSYTVSVDAGSRTVNLTGENDDLKSIYAIKIGEGTYARVLEYTTPQVFLRDYDAPDQTAGRPTRFTQLISVDGFPQIKFDCPLEVSETLKVYYHVELTPDNMAMARSISASVAGSLAYFFGVHTEAGSVYYAQFKELVRLAREADTYLPEAPSQFRIPKTDRIVRSLQAQLRSKRK